MQNLQPAKPLSKAEEIRNHIISIPVNTIINAANEYEAHFTGISEKTYYKVLERMAKDGILARLTKGLYYRPKRTRFGIIPLAQNTITDYYTTNGVVLGYPMYNKYGLTTQVGKSVPILSNNLTEEKKNIGTVSVEKTKIDLNEQTKPVVETLDILQNYSNIEDLNHPALSVYLTSFSNNYSDAATEYVLENRKYKKRTIAFLKAVLDYKGIKNTLSKYLSALSTYEIPGMEEIFEPAFA